MVHDENSKLRNVWMSYVAVLLSKQRRDEMKIHRAVCIENKYGGFTTHTLCGRDDKRSVDGFNSTDDPHGVTCKLCVDIQTNPNHWRYKKYL